MNDIGFEPTQPAAGTRTEVDPRVYLRVLWRWKWIFLVILVVIPAGVYAVVSRQHKVYQSSALLEIQPVAVNTSQFSAGGAPSSDQVLNAVAALMTTTPVARQAARHLHPRPVNPSSLLPSVTATADTDTGFISVVATAAAPRRAAQIANAFASAVAVTRAQQAVGSLNSAIAQATQELSALPVGDLTARKQLNSQIQQDRALRVAQGANAQVVQPALTDPTPISPHVTRAVALGLIAGLLLALCAVALAETADRRLRRADELEELTGSPLLSVIPKSAFSGKRPTPQEYEAFRMLHSTLTYFNVDRPRSTIVITSPGKGDGKTTVATQLALAAARAGEDTILVDADLRHPQLAGRIGLANEISDGTGIGMESVLVGRASLEEALVDHPLHARIHEGRLRVLPAFHVPPNPVQLLASETMRQLLHQLAAMGDRVIIDTSPALIVGDALPLFKAASGVLLVARRNSTHRHAIQRLRWMINSAGGEIIGAVATDCDSSGPYGAYVRGGYGELPAGDRLDRNGAPPVDPADDRRGRRRRRRNGNDEAQPETAGIRLREPL